MSRNPTTSTPVPGAATPLRARWQTLAPREQNLVRAAVALVVLALLWWLALAPALQTLRTAPARHATLDAQLQRMQALQAEAQQLQGAPRANPAGTVAGAGPQQCQVGAARGPPGAQQQQHQRHAARQRRHPRALGRHAGAGLAAALTAPAAQHSLFPPRLPSAPCPAPPAHPSRCARPRPRARAAHPQQRAAPGAGLAQARCWEHWALACCLPQRTGCPAVWRAPAPARCNCSSRAARSGTARHNWC